MGGKHNTVKVRGKLRQYIQTGGDQGKTWGTQVNEQDATVGAKLNTLNMGDETQT